MLLQGLAPGGTQHLSRQGLRDSSKGIFQYNDIHHIFPPWLLIFCMMSLSRTGHLGAMERTELPIPSCLGVCAESEEIPGFLLYLFRPQILLQVKCSYGVGACMLRSF